MKTLAVFMLCLSALGMAFAFYASFMTPCDIHGVITLAIAGLIGIMSTLYLIIKG